METTCDVSIVIVSYNTQDMLRDCLRSAFEQSQGVSIEVFVVDNASKDGSQEMVRKEFPQVRLIANDGNRGFAGANNQAIAQAGGRYVLLLNPDTVVLEGAIRKVVEYADGRPAIGALGCRVLWPNRTLQSTVFRYPGPLQAAIDALHLPDEWRCNWSRYGGMDFTREQDVEVVAGCFMLVRRETIEAVGALDEDFFMYGEESEWCFRIRRGGWRVVYYPGGEIIHIYGGSVNRTATAQLVRRKGQLLCVHKTRGLFVAWMANLIMLAGILPRVPVWLVRDGMDWLKGRVTAAVASARLKVIRFHLAGLVRPAWK